MKKVNAMDDRWTDFEKKMYKDSRTLANDFRQQVRSMSQGKLPTARNRPLAPLPQPQMKKSPSQKINPTCHNINSLKKIKYRRVHHLKT